MIVGGAQETVLLAAALADRQRFDPVIVCGPQTGSEGSLHDEVRRRGIELVIVPELVREVHPLKDARVVPALTNLFREHAFDVVHTNSSKAGIVGRLAARRAGVERVIHTVHGWPFHDRQRAVVAGVWRALERRSAPLAGRLVVVAEADRDKGLAARIGRPEQYVTVRSGLELQEYDPSKPARASVRGQLRLPDGVQVVGAVNRLSPQKDPLTLVEAFARVHEERPATHLLIVGDGPLRGRLEERVTALGVEGSVTLAGLREDVPRLLQAMDVFVSASLWEGLPRTVVAAMATGVPVVATLADGVRDVVRDGDTGLSFARDDASAAAVAIGTVLDDRHLAERLVAAALASVPEFDAVAMTRRLEELYAPAEVR
jgi:glycosyltransferase involved in cell wall biosynthesis